MKGAGGSHIVLYRVIVLCKVGLYKVVILYMLVC